MGDPVVRKAKPHQQYHLENGDKVVGVTTALNVISKGALPAWANKIGLQGIKMHEYVDDLADVGTCAHYLIQCHLTGETPDVQDYTPRQVDRAENAVISFHEWARDKVFDTHYSEEQLVSEKHKYGGTVDWFGEIGGRAVLIDIKTGKAIYDDHLYQVAAYAQLVIEQDWQIDEVRILQVGRDESEGFSEKMIPIGAILPYFNVFLSALNLYTAIRVTKKGA
ncbi:hypothetical protein LCGC14_2505830 [marine sediment metagenome]|uniref:PD-(D/E)XK endonuclease-like domain-containing protein n=1 Tax=marine sediment metagenome TaxID=412755 RepID=A0A0F9DCB0_9ZZZZ